MINPKVIDLYHGDVVTSFEAAHAAGIRGVIHKATEGATLPGSGNSPATGRGPAPHEIAGIDGKIDISSFDGGDGELAAQWSGA